MSFSQKFFHDQTAHQNSGEQRGYDTQHQSGCETKDWTCTEAEQNQTGDEGCLSVPGLAFNTERSFGVIATGKNMFGEDVVIEGSELLARCIQHETDHLDGILFIDRLGSEDRKAAMKEIRESEWFGLASANGQEPTIKVSPHNTFGRGN